MRPKFQHSEENLVENIPAVKPLRALQLVGHLGRGGDSRLILAAARTGRYHFDYVTHQGADPDLIQRLEEQGSRVFLLPEDLRQLGPLRYGWAIYGILRRGNYDLFHCHTGLQSGVALLAAALAGQQRRLCHSHCSAIQRQTSPWKRRLLTPLFRALIGLFATERMACGREAGRFLYGKRPFRLLPNGIDLELFGRDFRAEGQSLRESWGVAPGEKLLGHIGRLCSMKNQAFTLSLARRLPPESPLRFVLVGGGPQEEALRQELETLGRRVLLLGQREDLPQILAALDGLILPSLPGEGSPLTVLEAQAAGLPCLLSDHVPRDCDGGLGLLQWLPLEEEAWLQALGNLPPKGQHCAEKLAAQGFGLESFLKGWREIYEGK